MTTDILKVPYLRTSRNFPEEIKQLTVELNKAYIDTANVVNNRTISIFTSTNAALNGETWFPGAGIRQYGFRQIYPFVAANLPNIPHGLNFAQISAFSRIYGTATDGANWYPLPLVDTTSAENQISVIVTPGNTMTPGNIVITVGATAPAITSGYVVLEWLTNG